MQGRTNENAGELRSRGQPGAAVPTKNAGHEEPACIPSQIDFVLCRLPQRLGFYQWRIDQVFAQEPGLQFTGAKHITHHQIVGAGVAQFGGQLREFTAISDDELVRVEQARQLRGNLFAARVFLLRPDCIRRKDSGFVSGRRFSDAESSSNQEPLQGPGIRRP